MTCNCVILFLAPLLFDAPFLKDGITILCFVYNQSLGNRSNTDLFDVKMIATAVIGDILKQQQQQQKKKKK